MSETVTVSLITFLAALVGSLSGVLTAFISSKIAAKAKLQEVSVQTIVNARILKYEDFISTCVRFEKDFTNHERIAEMIISINAASIVSSAETAKLMKLYVCQLQELMFTKEETAIIKSEMLESMQKDLQTFKKPTVQ